MIQEYIRECLLFQTKEREIILAGVATWLILALNFSFWLGIITI